MMQASENETLTRVGPGTAMGEVMRRYWHPICTSAQVAKPDSDPLRSRLLGENFVVFRDTDGKVGVLNEYCMHRRVSLALGRVEKGGIRCLYHGWKFGADGTILETPNHCDARLRARVKAPAYPVAEAGGLVWTYIGDKAKQPPLPIWGFMRHGPEEHRVVVRLNSAANYLQLWEGGTDSSHVGILHSNMANPSWMVGDFTPSAADYNPGALSVGDNAPVLDMHDTNFGFLAAATRKTAPDANGQQLDSLRVVPIFFPTGRIVPAAAFQFYVLETPQNDYRTSTYIIVQGDKPIERATIVKMLGLSDRRFWNEKDCDFIAVPENGWSQDRTAMDKNWTGFGGIEQEDAVIAVSMGPIVDRSKEFLVTADKSVVHLRRLLLGNVSRVQAGEDPIGIGLRDCTSVLPVVDTVLQPDQDWREIVKDRIGSSAAA
jgi:phthalate 4,5-dioxygenase